MKREHTLGAAGEREAVSFLERLGFHIRERNYHTRLGEIDVIAEEGEHLVFTEVKTRTSLDRGLPREAVSPRKQQRLVRAAYHYLLAHPNEHRPCRFDVVEVVFVGAQVCEIHLIRDAFQPDEKDGVW